MNFRYLLNKIFKNKVAILFLDGIAVLIYFVSDSNVNSLSSDCRDDPS
jgi:hypothetical protein